MTNNIYVNFNKSLVALLVILGFAKASTGQLLPPDAFIQGNSVEVGQSSSQAFGSSLVAPATYHATNGILGFVADPALDGWTVGTPNKIGDYFVPGSPHEGWDIQIGTTRWDRAWGAGGFIGSGPGFPAPILTGSNTGIYIDGNRKIITWEGTMGALEISKKTILDTTKTYFIVEVVLKNNGTTILEDIYYERTVDPDNEQPITGDFTTSQSIVYQPSGLPGADKKCLVTGIGLVYPTLSYLGLGAVDCRARSYIIPGSLQPCDPPAVSWAGTGVGCGWAGPPLTGQDDDLIQDCGIGIVFQVGDLAPGDSTTLAYAYILKQEDLDSAFAVLEASWVVDGVNMGDSIVLEICRGKDVDVNITGGGAYEWGEWEPNIGLSNPSGRHNTITVQNEPITYRVIGTTTVCPENDTLFFTVIPVGDTTVINQSICAGEIYDFNGDPKYATGTYYQIYSTALEGCDSVVRLNLTVNPLPGVDISTPNTNICDDENALFTVNNPTSNTTYKWLKDGVVIPSATGPSYLAPPVPGEYRVVGVTDKGCTDTSRGITLRVNPSATVQIIDVDYGKVCIGDTIRLSVEALPGYEYYWSPEKAFRYTSGYRLPVVEGIMHEDVNVIGVKGINEYGCKATDEVTVVAVPCCEVMIPTAFSPNNDGLNDRFNLMLQPGQKLVTFQVFNRQGNLVYDNNDIVRGWDGSFENKGEALAQAVYFYRIVYTCTDGSNYELKGDITLVR